MDRETMPWRTIDAQSTSMSTTPAVPVEATPVAGISISRGTLALLGVAALVAVAAFALAYGSGTSGYVAVIGGAPLDVVASSAVDPSGGSATAGGAVVVEVVGAVVRPGVYRLPAGSRVDDLILAAGGFGPRVDTERAAQVINRAAVLTDGAQIRIPSRDDPDPGLAASASPGAAGTGGGSGSSGGAGGLIDLNTGTLSELDTLPGIGPVTANKIITSREEARFTAVEDLQTRRIVGEKTFDGLKDLVTVR